MRTRYDEKLLVASSKLVRMWPTLSRIEESGVTHGYQSVALWLNGTGYTDDGEHFKWLLEGFQPLRDARITRLVPGGYIKTHIDNGPYYERWQIPIHVQGVFWEDNEVVEQIPGIPWTVHHHLAHSVNVPENEERARLVILIDRQIPLGFGTGNDYRVLD
jgi:hypothetical protein